MNVGMWEYFSLENPNSICGRVYCSTSIIITNFVFFTTAGLKCLLCRNWCSNFVKKLHVLIGNFIHGYVKKLAFIMQH
jgi:hypothetical protein